MDSLFERHIIKSVNYNEKEIITDIMDLYLGGQPFDLDPTYSRGNFYKGLPRPEYKFDIIPQSEDVGEADCRSLPFADNTLGSIMYDPPFVVAQPSGRGKDGIIRKRFGYYKTIPELWQFYSDSLKEFYRILKPNGWLVFKCQDTVDSSKQYLSHVYIINEAAKLGFYCKDLFVYCVKNRIVDQRKQQHARKFHSYFLVFQKKDINIRYF